MGINVTLIVLIVGGLLAYLAWHNAPRLLGYPSPKIQFAIRTRHRLKLWCGLTVQSHEIDCPDGYLYSKVTYSDGSTLYIRE